MGVQFACDPDGATLYRIDAPAVSTRPLYAERLEAGQEPRWVLDHAALELTSALRPVTWEEAERLAGSARLLDQPGEAASPSEGRHIDDDDRVAWLSEAIEKTLAGIEARRSVYLEITMSRQGSWDYDYAIDSLGWMRLAFVTVEAMCREREMIVTRQSMRDSTEYQD